MDIKLPELGENIAQGTVSKILVKVGDSVKKGQNIVELETDKAVLEVPSPSEGTVKEILIKAGQVVKVGQPAFKFDNGTAPAAASSTTAPKPAAASPAPAAAAPSKPASPASQPSAASGAVVITLPPSDATDEAEPAPEPEASAPSASV